MLTVLGFIAIFIAAYFVYKNVLLAIDSFFEEPNKIKKLQSITVFIRTEHLDTDKFIVELLEKSDFQLTYIVLSTLRDYLQKGQIGHYFNPDAAQNQFDALKETARLIGGMFAADFCISSAD